MTVPAKPTVPGMSGERFRVVYHLSGDEADARKKAETICIEQTVEFPAELVPEGDIRDHIFGQIESLNPLDNGKHEAVISFADEISGFDLVQFLNVVFGNISILPGIRVERMDLSEGILKAFKGPRFGKDGWRDLLGVQDRPLLATALKPMGLNAAELADMAYKFAIGGMDIIKDDHGLANQHFSPFEERVQRCAEAVAKANQETGGNCQYMPNISGPADVVIDRARFAKRAGAGSYLVCPGLVGFDTMRQLAEDPSTDLPIMSHPSYYGSMVTSPDNGMSHYALYGQLQRLAGADASIYPNFGGRFSFSKDECRSIVAGCEVEMGDIKPIFAAPGGGMTMERVPEMREVYGQEVIYLIGGGLHRHSKDIVENVRYFKGLIS